MKPKTVVDDLWALSGEEEVCLALELTRELTDAIDQSLDMALAVSRDSGSARTRALLHALCVDLAAARDFEPEQARASTPAFACDAPLTPDLRRDTLDVPVGTAWSEETKWPTGVGARLRTVSRKYRSGRYLVEIPAPLTYVWVVWVGLRACTPCPI
ncbi:hypothetical protein KGQ20_40130 [Catenulispora sp. NF23]|uniref:hypothetical protein n=1 Tax=Catenulispora pinistramenti TaxID=2705254 RepID=UPI001BA79DC1|nr:hypothetical protein [Catenulispora pinistramenti]MBS2538974.1 hypothetical protein [Catenulispora pinistramenti]